VKGRFEDQIIELISRNYFSDLSDVILKKVAYPSQGLVYSIKYMVLKEAISWKIE